MSVTQLRGLVAFSFIAAICFSGTCELARAEEPDIKQGSSADYAALATAISAPFTLNPAAPKPFVPNGTAEYEKLLIQLEKSPVQPINKAAKRMQLAAIQITRLEKQVDKELDILDEDVKRIAEKAANGEYIYLTERIEEQIFRGKVVSTTRTSELVDEGGMRVLSSQLGLAYMMMKAPEKKRVAALNIMEYGCNQAWKELTRDPSIIYPGAKERAGVIDVSITHPDPEKKTPGYISVTNRTREDLRNVTLLLDIVHVTTAPAAMTKYVFVKELKTGQSLYLSPSFTQKFSWEKGHIETRLNETKIGLDQVWLANLGGVVEIRFKVWADNLYQNEESQTFPTQARAVADWELRLITRMIAEKNRLVKAALKNKALTKNTPSEERFYQEIIDYKLSRVRSLKINDSKIVNFIEMVKTDSDSLLVQYQKELLAEIDGLTKSGRLFGGTWTITPADRPPGEADIFFNKAKEITAAQVEGHRYEGGVVGLRIDGHNPKTGLVVLTIFDITNLSRVMQYVGKIKQNIWGDPYLELKIDQFPDMRSKEYDRARPVAFDFFSLPPAIELRSFSGGWVASVPGKSKEYVFTLALSPTTDEAVIAAAKKVSTNWESLDIKAIVNTFKIDREFKGDWKIETGASELSQDASRLVKNTGVNHGELTVKVLDLDENTREITLRFARKVSDNAPQKQESPRERRERLAKEAKAGGNADGSCDRVGRIMYDQSTQRWILSFQSRLEESGKTISPRVPVVSAAEVDPIAGRGALDFTLDGTGISGKQEVRFDKKNVWVTIRLVDSSK